MAWKIDHYTSTTVRKEQSRSGVNTSMQEEWAVVTENKIHSTSVIPIMRTQDITVTGTRFKPNTKYYCFFDSIDVNAYMTPSTAVYDVLGAGTPVKGSGLKSDNKGKILATFTIPTMDTDGVQFTTGRKEFKLTESETDIDTVLSRGSAIYEATGVMENIETTETSTRNGVIIINPVSEEDTISEVTTVHTGVEWVDPLAQSFLVNTEGGIFVTSIDLFFAVTDPAFDVTVQLRHMENGIPTQKQLPFGEITLDPDPEGDTPGIIKTSADAQTATKFTFPSPIYLEAKGEYCIVLMTNSNEYTVWVSEHGQKDINSDDFIDQQPYAGSLFKSQNNSTWTPDQMRDLKMTLYRAEFTTGAPSSIIFENATLPINKLKINPIETISGTKTFRVKHRSHGNYDQAQSNISLLLVEADRIGSVFSFADDTVTKSSGTVANGTYTDRAPSTTTGTGTGMTVTFAVTSNETTSLTITNPGQGYVAGNTVTFTNFATDAGAAQTNVLVLNIAAVKDTLGGIPIEYMGDIIKNHVAGGSASGSTSSAKILADIDEYLITIPDATWPVRINADATTPNYQGATENTTGGGSNVHASQNMYFDIIHTVMPSIELPNTGITTSFKATSATQPIFLSSPANSYTKDTSSTNITLNDNNYLSVPKLVASDINEIGEMNSAKSFELTCQLSSTQSNVSPVLDQRTRRTDIDAIGIIAIQNRINKIDSTTDVQAGTYVSATEARGDNNAAIYMTKRVQLENPANALHILFDAYRTPHAVTNPSIDVYYKISGPDSNLQFDDLGWVLGTIKKVVQPDATTYKEYLYEIEGLEDFNMFAIKIVLQSIDSANPPMIRNFRTIALST